MWLLLKLFYRTFSRLLHRFGLGLLLVPVTAVGLALFGLHAWTILAVLMAMAVAFWWPAVAAALLPVTMVAVGIAGLVLAATMAGPSGNWMTHAISVFQVNALGPPKGEWVVKGRAGVQVVAIPAKAGPGFYLPAPGQARLQINRVAVRWPGSGAGQQAVSFGQGQAVSFGKGTVSVANGKAVRVPPNPKLPVIKRILRTPPRIRRILAGPPPPGRFNASTVFPGPRPDVSVWARCPAPAWPAAPFTGSPWPGRLVPVALLLIALGLWLAPRTFAQYRSRAQGLQPYLRRRMQEIRWGILLVPVTVLGLTVFGPYPWMLAAIAAAVLITLRWPRIAADLVPVVLIAYALSGFMLTARWESWPLVVLARHPQLYGFVMVSSRQLAVVAGAEASAFLAVAAWLFPRTVVRHARMTANPGPNLELEGRVQRLTETRDQALDSATSELRRIERDLHDGAQARLVALGMNLRAVERILPASPEAALALVAEARETSVRALNDLRDLIRGICPPVLADRGLGHAVRALALDTPLPVVLDIGLPGRLSAPVESACYFAVAEVLANAVKHSGARLVHLRIQHSGSVLRIEVSDDGVGGADPANGTGLRGVERRLGTFDGILAVNSPTGGPTMIVMEVPCALLSPKTCSC